jgi:hypothetical protein
MTNKLKVISTLIFYDVPHLFIARDVVGTTHLCLLVDDSGDNLRYLTIPVSPDRISKILNGVFDLRKAFEEPELRVWQIIEEFDDNFGYSIKADFQSVPEEYLPGEGFFLPIVDAEEHIIVTEALQKDNTIIHLSLADGSDTHSVQADVLGDFVKLFQSLVKNTFKKTISHLPKQDKKALDQEYNWALRAFAASPGSLNIHFEGTAQKELFGGSKIEKALEKIDELTSAFVDPEAYLDSLREVKGHTVTSYRRIVEKIIKENVKIKYKWYSPGEKTVHKREITRGFAEQVLVIINQKNDLSQEIKEFKGVIKSADVKNGNWRIFDDEEGKEYSGISTTGQLDGIVIETQKYRLICEEEITVSRVSDREEIVYKIISIEELE